MAASWISIDSCLRALRAYRVHGHLHMRVQSILGILRTNVFLIDPRMSSLVAGFMPQSINRTKQVTTVRNPKLHAITARVESFVPEKHMWDTATRNAIILISSIKRLSAAPHNTSQNTT